MIPEGGIIQGPLEETEETSRTWHLDFEAGRIAGMADGLQAMQQAVYMALRTDRYRHLIYSYDYGSELSGLVGSHSPSVRSDAARMIREALEPDDRIIGIEDVEVETAGDGLRIRFTVHTTFGNFQMEQEVNANV
ncbi:hypothetical protein IJ21_00310 [Paenibacillus sp. 32O-W]|jgi:hypothetical protein|uniref:Phage protein n=1 Tax=Paenibacillus cisolokensis TaxID=1658519 RepID=A0ABQ4N1T3_9BACL|nr:MULTISPECIES: DUF2634 domain-containing protein [Paenibacillus]ALS25486.1 hypothetical protein IJ21_00310 [Paenibacillus sp. 32O-W]GIQ62129.1 phage protein [Paenibacillus cisolokensis]